MFGDQEGNCSHYIFEMFFFLHPQYLKTAGMNWKFGGIILGDITTTKCKLPYRTQEREVILYQIINGA